MPMPITRTNFWLGTSVADLRDRFASVQAATSAALARRARFRRTYAELSALSDRELGDIGIARAQIRRVAKQELLQEQKNEI